MERNSESEEYDEETLVGFDAAGTVLVMIEVMVFDSTSGKWRRRKKKKKKRQMYVDDILEIYIIFAAERLKTEKKILSHAWRPS